MDLRQDPGGQAASGRIGLLVAAVAVMAAAFVTAALLAGLGRAATWLAGFAAALVFGSATVFGPAIVPQVGMGTWGLAVVTAAAAVFDAFVYAYNVDLLERIPRVGRRLRRARRRAEENLARHPWIERLATVGVALFVLLPVVGSGSLGGALLGRLLGLSPLRTWLATAAGGVVIAFVHAALAGVIKGWLDAGGVGVALRLVGTVVVVGGGWLLLRRWDRASHADHT